MVIVDWVGVEVDSSVLKDEINEGIFKGVNIFELFGFFVDWWVTLVIDEFVGDYRKVELVCKRWWVCLFKVDKILLLVYCIELIDNRWIYKNFRRSDWRS